MKTFHDFSDYLRYAYKISISTCTDNKRRGTMKEILATQMSRLLTEHLRFN